MISNVSFRHYTGVKPNFGNNPSELERLKTRCSREDQASLGIIEYYAKNPNKGNLAQGVSAFVRAAELGNKFGQEDKEKGTKTDPDGQTKISLLTGWLKNSGQLDLAQVACSEYFGTKNKY